MRISDWSSDVCSSDLGTVALECAAMPGRAPGRRTAPKRPNRFRRRRQRPSRRCIPRLRIYYRRLENACAILETRNARQRRAFLGAAKRRSEEHTSELQSLMRISYAVFCLKKKIILYTHTNNQQQHLGLYHQPNN